MQNLERIAVDEFIKRFPEIQDNWDKDEHCRLKQCLVIDASHSIYPHKIVHEFAVSKGDIQNYNQAAELSNVKYQKFTIHTNAYTDPEVACKKAFDRFWEAAKTFTFKQDNSVDRPAKYRTVGKVFTPTDDVE